MNTRTDPWLDLPFKAMRLCLEAQTVIQLRLIKLSLGGMEALFEAELMVSEKAWTAMEAQSDFLTHSLAGRHHRATSRTLALYRQRVRTNRRRLAISF